jgi:hypothetical protein
MEIAINQKQHDRDKRSDRGLNNTVMREKSGTFVWVGLRRSSKSEAWKYWGFKKYPQQLVNYDKMFCKVCDHAINYIGSSTNMIMHLRIKHLTMTEEKSVTQTTASQYFQPTQPRMIKYPKHHPIIKQARASMVKWFCNKDIPFLMADDDEFQDFCEILNPQFELPSRMTLTRDMETTYNSEKGNLIEKLDTVDVVFGTNDGGSAINGESVHYKDPETWELKYTVLACEVMIEK